MYPETLEMSGKQLPYFRTSEFSEIMLENEVLLKESIHAPKESKVIFLTASGTAAMEAAVINCFTSDDRLLVIQGGSFGRRFSEICRIHKIPFDELILSFGEVLTKEKLEPYNKKGYSGLLVNLHETLSRIEDVIKLFHSYPSTMISGRKDIIRQLESNLRNYRAYYGTIFILDKYRHFKASENIEKAVPDDAEEIARLICSDGEIGSHYTVIDLARQLKERIQSKTGRSYIIRRNGEIIAHTATYAETGKIAVVGGTIVKQEYRNLNYYMLLSNHILQQLIEEGKTAYTFSITEKMIQFHKKIHTQCSEYGKLIINK